ncbi:MAG: hypothetical protein H0V03_12665, partial [Thermoleophilaceae bacterium]|nr:hypothetical protein [Thermoleophilaceae bacterium]
MKALLPAGQEPTPPLAGSGSVEESSVAAGGWEPELEDPAGGEAPDAGGASDSLPPAEGS